MDATLIVVAVIGAASGFLGLWRSRNLDAAAAKAAAREARKTQDRDALHGFSLLIQEMRRERERDKTECERRIRNVELDLLRRIAELEGHLDEAKGG